MAIKHVLLDNRSLGKISKEQLAGQLPVWQTSLINPDFAGYARSCGAVGIPVSRCDELADGMKALFEADGPALLHVHADAELV
jgi:thiamine pyrophosphate-dependent acetolactate synthase large subunit-like protein